MLPPDLDTRPQILVIDDDERIRTLVTKYLNDHGFLAIHAQDAKEAAAILGVARFDALVVDVMMPGQTGRDFTKALRSQNNDTPILLLTAMGEAEDRVQGLISGADDYLTKPFDPRELVLRLHSILRRRPKTGDTGAPVRIGPWRYDPALPELVGDAGTVRLTDVEVTLLQALLKTPGEVISREDLADLCGLSADTRAMDVQVARLRRKIEANSKLPRYLLTLRGKGYLLRAEL